MEYLYKSGEEIKKGDLITVDYGYEHCIILKLFTDEQELKEWGWNEDPGAGAFAYSYIHGVVDYCPMKVLQSEETRLLGRCSEPIFADLDQMWTRKKIID